MIQIAWWSKIFGKFGNLSPCTLREFALSRIPRRRLQLVTGAAEIAAKNLLFNLSPRDGLLGCLGALQMLLQGRKRVAGILSGGILLLGDVLVGANILLVIHNHML